MSKQVQDMAEVADDDFVHVSATTSQAELQRQTGAAGEEERPDDDQHPGETARPPKPKTPPANTEPGKAEPEKPDEKAPKEAPGKGSKDPEKRVAALKEEIASLTREKHQTRQEKEAAAAELADLRAQLATAKADLADGKGKVPVVPAQKERAPEPKEDDFEDFRDWVKAHSAWTREQAKLDAEELVATSRKTADETAKATAEQAETERRVAYRRELADKHRARITTYVTEHPEFATLMEQSGALPTNPAIDEHILHSEYGPRLMHYLAAHPEECEELAGLGMGPTLIRLGKLEAAFEREDAAAAAPAHGSGAKRPPVTKAAPPVSPVGGGSEVVDDDDDDTVLDDDFGPEYVRKMNARDRKRHAARV